VLLVSEGIDATQMFEACQRVYMIDPNCLFCLNYLVAQMDYMHFIGMMLEYKQALNWQENEENYENDQFEPNVDEDNN
jgi:hypothetical protein